MKIQNKHILSKIQEKPLIITIGIFDGVHRGHRYFINKMKEKAQKHSLVPVIILLYPHPDEILSGKKFRYLTTLEEKKELINQLDVGHLLVLQTTRLLLQKSAVGFIDDLKTAGLNIKMVAMGYNNHFGNPKSSNADINKLIEDDKPDIYTVEAFSEKVNSTLIREELRLGKVDSAAEMLGHPYVLFGKVVEGNKMGRTIGFPTANIQMSSVKKMVPAAGVYAVICHVGGREFPGMMNIGYRPTFREETKNLVLEVHVPEKTLDIYDHAIKIKFYKKIRDEKLFSGMNALKTQLKKDRDFIKSYFSSNFAGSNKDN